VDAEPLIYREEVTATLFMVNDIAHTLAKILELLEETHGEDQEDDA
jgi:hypothetical protein